MAKIQSNTPLDIIINGNTIFTANSSGIIITGSIDSTISIVSSSYASTASYVNTAETASFVNTLNQNVLISGSLTVGAPVAGSPENTLTLGPRDNGSEGGQLMLSPPGGTYTSASMIDNYQNKLRFLRGTTASSDAYKMQIDMHTGQVQIPNYNSATALVGTSVATLGVDSNGNMLTTMPFTSSYLINTQTTAAGVNTTINDLTFTTNANEAWAFEATFVGQCSGTGGVRFTVVYSAVPAASSVWYWGNSSQVGNMTGATSILTTPAQSGTMWATATPIDVQASIKASFVNGASANTVTIKVQPVNAGQTATIRAMSYLTARRIT